MRSIPICGDVKKNSGCVMPGVAERRAQQGRRWLDCIDNRSHLDYCSSMFVCICNAVSDREICNLARRGVETLEELRLLTGCSDCCGQCAPEAESILLATRAAVAAERGAQQPVGLPRPVQHPF